TKAATRAATTRAPRRRGPRSASERVALLLIMLPWLMARKRVKISTIAAQFRMSEEDLIADIQMASVCGVPPYTPDALIDVYVDEDMVIAETPTMFSRPLRLSAAELFALTAMVRAAQKLPGASKRSTLSRAVQKLERLLPTAEEPVVIDLPDEPHLAELRSALDDMAEVRIEYFNPNRNEASFRTIRPLRVFADMGHWYVQADDDKSGDTRIFRIDRINSMVRTGKTYDHVDVASRITDDTSADWFGAEYESVTLRVRDDAMWIAEQYPTVSRTKNRDGSLDVVLRVTSEHWLARVLLRGGTNVEVLSPDTYVNLAQRTAAAVRARYATTR
ncbi:MAG: WYL domain-containing protein, partial [Actinobacteria bacterium]|nr:WYL domain-containing protein [Actinomycetota bacterium]